jgi:glycosyltransferase involved in cell wall biosynthesis
VIGEVDGRIALFMRDLAGGGVGRVIVNLAKGFVERGHEVDVVLARARGPYLGQLEPQIRVVDLGVDRTLSCVPGLVRYLRRDRPQALVACTDGANVVALWAKRVARVPTRVLITIHTNVSLNARQSTMARGRLIPHFVKRFYPWADDVVAVSEGVADDLATIAGLDRSCISVIYNPVDIERIVALAKEPLGHPWFTPGAPPVILGIGRLTRQKDFPTLFQAFDRVRRRHPARLLILGEGRDRAALEALASELGCEADSSLPGFVDNPYPFIAAARVFVLSSAWEGFGNALVEAMALGTPVISTDCPSGPAEILGHGRYGRLLPVGDVAGLAQAIEEALAMRRDGNAGIDRAAQFSIPIVTAQYLDAIERVRQ